MSLFRLHMQIYSHQKNVIKYIICGQVTSSYTTFVCMKVSYEVCQAKCKHFVLHSYLATGHATCSCWRKAITVAFAERVRVEPLHSGFLTCQSVCSCSNLGNLLSLFSNSTLRLFLTFYIFCACRFESCAVLCSAGPIPQAFGGWHFWKICTKTCCARQRFVAWHKTQIPPDVFSLHRLHLVFTILVKGKNDEKMMICLMKNSFQECEIGELGSFRFAFLIGWRLFEKSFE